MKDLQILLGVDPGLSGALAFYDGHELMIHDMPTLTITKNGKEKRRVDLMALLGILRTYPVKHCFLEAVNAMPGQGVTSMFSMGRTFGHIEMGIASCNIPITEVHPRAWKQKMNCTADKDSSRLRASQLLPNEAHQWSRKKDDGRAEATLLALYGWGNLGYDLRN